MLIWKKKMDIRYTLNVTLEELYNGIEKKITYFANELCKTCNYDQLSDCQICLGDGTLFNYEKEDVLCAECFGSGKNFKNDRRCHDCSNVGIKINIEKYHTVNINRGMMPNQEIILKGKGHSQPFMETGNLIVIIDVKSHPLFEFKNNSLDLYYRINIAIDSKTNEKDEKDEIKTEFEQKLIIPTIDDNKINLFYNNLKDTVMNLQNGPIELGLYGLYHQDLVHRGKFYLISSSL